MATSAGAALLSAVVVVVAASCVNREPTRPAAKDAHVHIAPRRVGAAVPDLGDEMAELRRATVRYHDFAAAQAEGYTVKVTDCM
jgi:hypothetical protein